MACQDCCIYCDKDKKQCEDRKERGRAVDRAIYKAKKNKNKSLEGQSND